MAERGDADPSALARARLAEVPERAVVPERLREALLSVLAASDLVHDLIRRHPGDWNVLVGDGSLEHRAAPDRFEALAARILEADTRDELIESLRGAKRAESLRIAFRDLGGLADLSETLADLTALADALIGAALDWLTAEHEKRRGTPVDAEGDRLGLVVIGMGKLGGGELNFSSDVDLVLAYPAAGVTGGERGADAEQFFQRLGRDLAQVLSEVTADGYVYRVDLRLRPHGEAGRLALSFAAMEDYYQREGRDWERYAWIKARLVAGDLAAGEALLSMLRPFVYRRYLDYPALEALRDLKQQIVAQVRRGNLEDDIKLGAGGIREIEFIAQVFQLIRGGRDPALRDRRLLTTLERLGERRLISSTAEAELREAYRFLRRLENRLQMYRDEQTHELPADAAHRSRIAYAMEFDDWRGLEVALERHRARVRGHFESVFREPDTEGDQQTDTDLRTLWYGDLPEDEALAALQRIGFRDPGEARKRLDQFRGGNRVRAMDARGRSRLDRFMPGLLAALEDTTDPDAALSRLLPVLEAIARRSAYLVLLLENPPVVERLCRLCGDSGWVAEQLARTPILLDELINPQPYDTGTDWEVMRAELERALGAVPPGDLEQELEAVAQFKRAATLRIALAELSGRLDAVQAGRQLSALARAVLARALRLASREHRAGSFSVIAYGRLGAGELSYDSDLDLVFLFGGEPASDATRAHVRVARRLIHLLTTPTHAGRLYPVDTRLRPNGQAGLLVSPLSAYREYQSTEAWTWEQQALVRARFVAGDRSLGQDFEAVRRDVLVREREPEQLRAEVAQMRDRMRREHRAGGDDPKQGPGGLVDLEFLVQYLVLANAHGHPELAAERATPELLGMLAEEGLLDRDETDALIGAHRALLSVLHRRTLGVTGEEPVEDHREAALRAWRRYLHRD